MDLNPSAPSVALPSTVLPSGVRNDVNDADICHSVSHISKSKPVVFYPSKECNNWIIGEDSKLYLHQAIDMVYSFQEQSMYWAPLQLYSILVTLSMLQI